MSRGDTTPSSEWAMHAAIYRAYPSAKCIVHTHADACTALACLNEALPAFHYMIANFGGDDVRCAPYVTFGTPELAQLAVQSLAGRTACLLANHGMIVHAATHDRALSDAIVLETLCRQYLLARSAGTVRLLTAEEMPGGPPEIPDLWSAGVNYELGARDRQRNPVRVCLRLYQQGKIRATCLVRGLYCSPHIVRGGNRLSLHVDDDIAWHDAKIACLTIALHCRHQGASQRRIESGLFASLCCDSPKPHAWIGCRLDHLLSCLIPHDAFGWHIVGPCRYGHGGVQPLAVTPARKVHRRPDRDLYDGPHEHAGIALLHAINRLQHIGGPQACLNRRPRRINRRYDGADGSRVPPALPPICRLRPAR